MSTLKFSQFTEISNATPNTYIVGYDGIDNIRIEPSNFIETYSLTAQNQSGQNNITLRDSDNVIQSTVTFVGSANVTVSALNDVIYISSENTTNVDLDYDNSTFLLSLEDSSGVTRTTSLAALAGGSDKNYVHTQGTASATWNIVHNLNKYASVTVVDSNNVVVHGEIEYINTNEVEITFRAAFSGEAYLN